MRPDSPSTAAPQPAVVDTTDDDLGDGEDDRHENLFFRPALYLMRYDAVLKVLSDERWAPEINKVVDFGCAECKFLQRLKSLPYLREALGVDVDQGVLERSAAWVAPIPYDYLKPRENFPLDIHLLCGSVTEPDPRLRGADAVVAIELIEHLTPEALSRFPSTVFGYVRPKLVVVTTPNSEFNVLFPNFEGPFRHWDHKFEWTRQEFRDWAAGIVGDYQDYTVLSFGGVGADPNERRRSCVGYCSQIAVFVRRDFLERARNGDALTPSIPEEEGTRPQQAVDSHSHPDEPSVYSLVASHHFVYRADDRSREKKVFDEIVGYVRLHALYSEEWTEQRSVPVDLEFILTMSGVEALQTNMDEVRTVLTNEGYNVVFDDESGGYKVIYPYDQTSSVDSSDHSDNEEPRPVTEWSSEDVEYEEDWD